MKFHIETYGCQMNQADSEIIAGILGSEGYVRAASIEEADLILFNTCTVRQHAEDRVLGRISQEIARKNDKPNLRIGVVGCVAQRLGDKLLQINPKIDFVLGVDQYRTLPMTLRLLDDWGVRANNDLNPSIDYNEQTPVRTGRHNAFVTIMRGCDNHCSYCIVPYVRGHERSRPADSILAEMHYAAVKGFKDITLLGQNVNSYAWGNSTFADLLKRACGIGPLRRLRFVTSHPKDLSDRLIEVMATQDKVCEHIHLPVQSGSNAILERMNRNYTVEHYRELVRKLREAMPDIAITTDIMTGFPGETEDDFRASIELMELVRFDYAFTFKYSPREGTPAAGFDDQIPEEVRLARLQQMIDVQTRITGEVYRAQIGKEVEVYVEGLSKKSDHELSGRTRDFKIAVFEGDPLLTGSFVPVKITAASGWTLRGEQL